MKNLSYQVKLLQRRNAMHRKGWRINDLTIPQLFNHIHGELSELYDEVTNNDNPDPTVPDSPHAKREMGDVFGALYNLMNRLGWTPEEIERHAIDKLNERFESIKLE